MALCIFGKWIAAFVGWALIDYLTQPQTQIVTARNVGFFPAVKADLPPDLDLA